MLPQSLDLADERTRDACAVEPAEADRGLGSSLRPPCRRVLSDDGRGHVVGDGVLEGGVASSNKRVAPHGDRHPAGGDGRGGVTHFLSPAAGPLVDTSSLSFFSSPSIEPMSSFHDVSNFSIASSSRTCTTSS